VLLLTEYTPDAQGRLERAAEIRMTKKVTDGRISWSGTMNNTDGRQFEIEMSRPR
jgi:hypothetical protein